MQGTWQKVWGGARRLQRQGALLEDGGAGGWRRRGGPGASQGFGGAVGGSGRRRGPGVLQRRLGRTVDGWGRRSWQQCSCPNQNWTNAINRIRLQTHTFLPVRCIQRSCAFLLRF